MKRIISIFILIILCISFTSCATVGGHDYDNVTSVFIKRTFEEDNELTSYQYSVRYDGTDNSTVSFSALSFNLDGSITELTNYEVDEQMFLDAVKICKDNNVLNILKGYDPANLTPDNYTGVFYTVTLQFKDGSEAYGEYPAPSEWMNTLEEFFASKAEGILSEF